MFLCIPAQSCVDHPQSIIAVVFQLKWHLPEKYICRLHSWSLDKMLSKLQCDILRWQDGHSGAVTVLTVWSFFSLFGKDESRMSTEEQLRRLQEERMCKVCLDRDVSVVFVPCGHLVACGECALNLRSCPICRAVIWRSVRTFMSWTMMSLNGKISLYNSLIAHQRKKITK